MIVLLLIKTGSESESCCFKVRLLEMPFGLPGLCIEPGWATEHKFLNDTLDTSNDAKREGPQLE